MIDMPAATAAFRKAVQSASEPAALGQALEAFASNVGVATVTYLVSPRQRNADGSIPDPMLALIRPKPCGSHATWRNVAMRMRAPQTGMLYRACEDTTLPIVWYFDFETNRMQGIDASLTASQIAMYRKCAELTGISAGISIPLHRSDDIFGFLTFLTDDRLRLEDEMSENADAFLAVAHRFHAAMRGLIAMQAGARYDLSAREIECLRWLSLGRSLEETAELVGIAYGTVRFHLRTAQEKLGATSRAHAIAKAAYLGLLGAFH